MTDNEAVTLVVFDLDGTLIDSRQDLTDSVNAMLAGIDRPPIDVDDVTQMVGEGARRLVNRALARAGAPARNPADVDRALARFLACYEDRLLRHTRPYPGVTEMLEAVRARHRLAVLTNKPLRHTRRILEGLHLLRFFDRVEGGDGALPRKPDPAGLLELVEELGSTPSETVLVGDSLVDLETARAAGVTPCLVAYGFGYPAGETASLAGVPTVPTPSDLAAWLR